MLDYGLSNATFETPNHAFAPMCSHHVLKRFMWCSFMFLIWVLKVPQHVFKSNNTKQWFIQT